MTKYIVAAIIVGASAVVQTALLVDPPPAAYIPFSAAFLMGNVLIFLAFVVSAAVETIKNEIRAQNQN